MTSGARPLRVEGRESFPLATHRVEVLRAEGAVQLLLMIDGFPAGPDRLANIFAGPETADQLQSIVDHLRGLRWES